MMRVQTSPRTMTSIDLHSVPPAATLPFLRHELTSLQAYTPHPGGAVGQSGSIELIDRLDTNESPYDLPLVLKQQLAQMWVEEIESNRYPDGGTRSSSKPRSRVMRVNRR